MSENWTVGDLRKALDGLPDALPVTVNVSTHNTDREINGYIPFGIESGDLNNHMVDDETPFSYFELNCNAADAPGVIVYLPDPPDEG